MSPLIDIAGKTRAEASSQIPSHDTDQLSKMKNYAKVSRTFNNCH